jgi:hypothetical protein
MPRPLFFQSARMGVQVFSAAVGPPDGAAGLRLGIVIMRRRSSDYDCPANFANIQPEKKIHELRRSPSKST